MFLQLSKDENTILYISSDSSPYFALFLFIDYALFKGFAFCK